MRDITNATKKNNVTVRVHVRGVFHKFWKRPFVKKALHRIGVTIKSIEKTPSGDLEMVLSGTYPLIWASLEVLSGTRLYFILHEIAFEFI